MDLLESYLLTEVLDREGITAVKNPKSLAITPMTPEEFAAKMQKVYDLHYIKEDDEEVVHSVMDTIMCNLLRQLGYGDGVDIFINTPKWYA